MGTALLLTCSVSIVAKHYANASPPSTNADLTPAPEAQQAPHPGGQGSTILVDAHGLLIAVRTAGLVIRADRDGQALAQLSMKPNLGQLVHDNEGVVFVADRMADRVVRIDPGDARGQGLAELGSVSVREPWGLALTPDSKLLLVTSVADHELLAFDVESLQLRWRVRLAAGPRPVAVSPNGEVAAVGVLVERRAAIVELSTPEPRVSWRALDPRDHVDIVVEQHRIKGYRTSEPTTDVIEARSRFRVPVETSRQYARNIMGLGFVGEQLIATHQLATPQLERMPQEQLRDTYGGGAHEIQPIVDSIVRQQAGPARLVGHPGTAHPPATDRVRARSPRAAACTSPDKAGTM